MNVVKSLPRKCCYLYTTEDVFGITKVYKTKHRIYLVTRENIYSISPVELRKLTNKIYDYVESLPKTEELSAGEGS